MMQRKPILRVTAKLLIPLIMLFALYVQFHGDFGPGGGFQAGVIFASAFILYSLVYGVDTMRKVWPAWLSRVCLSLGVLIYGGTGVVSMFMGGQYLNYSVLAHDPVHGQHYGILIIEFGVGLTVAAAMVTIFAVFASRIRERIDHAAISHPLGRPATNLDDPDLNDNRAEGNN